MRRISKATLSSIITLLLAGLAASISMPAARDEELVIQASENTREI